MLTGLIWMKVGRARPPTLGFMMTIEKSVNERSVLCEMLDHLKQVRQCERDEDLARLIGIAPSTLSHYRSGSRWPGIDNCERIAALLGIDPEEVIDAVKAGRRGAGKAGRRVTT